MNVLRSLLFVPGNNYRAIIKTPELNSDGIIYDMEDAVPIDEKETARIFVRDAVKIERPEWQSVFVRVNSFDTGFTDDDLNAIVDDGLTGIMLPKSESENDIVKLDEKLSMLEKERNIQENIKIIPLIESPKGVINAHEIASASNRNVAIAFGAGDYYRMLGRSYFRFSENQMELLFARAAIVNAAKAAGIKAIDTPFFGLLTDREGLLRESKMVWQLGFDGKLIIHPNQIDIVNEVFSPSEKDIEYAQEVVKVYEEAKASGLGVTTLGGRMIDYATYVQAKDILSMADSISKRG